MIKKNEKGFALVLSLVLLLVMSLMGGALIVVSSGDHQSNNSSDQYQQAFYVAETGLLEAEKNIINQYMGPWTDVSTIPAPGAESSEEEQIAHIDYITELAAKATGGYTRHTAARSVPINNRAPSDTDCYRSFRNIKKDGFQVTDHIENQNFGTLIEPIFLNASALDSVATSDQIEKEKKFLKRFRYEYFSVNIGSAPYHGFGSSIKKSASSTESLGTAFKIYACGIMVEKGTDLDKMNAEIIIPLESIIVMPN
tara:strand:- start:194 stop:955 length:762 start_codon:yes stop_codon:yes gene_type:complete